MSEWISVDERLPDHGVDVWVYRPLAHLSHDPAMCVSYRKDYENKSPQGIPHPFNCWCHVTHWQPLPLPPQ